MAARGRLAAQTEGAIERPRAGAGTGRSLGGAQVLVDERVGAVTDTGGSYRVRAVRTGWHRVAARLIGYRGIVLDSVFVRGGRHRHGRLRARGQRRRAGAARGDRARWTSCSIRWPRAPSRRSPRRTCATCPVSSLDEAIALSAGASDRAIGAAGSARSRSFSTAWASRTSSTPRNGGLGLPIPPDMLGEASLVTNGFSARYGQALSGLVNVVTRDPGETWEGRAAIETDRPFGGGAGPRPRSRCVLRGRRPAGRAASAWWPRSTSPAGWTTIR